MIAVAGVITVTTTLGKEPTPAAAPSAPATPAPATPSWWEKEITVSLCSDGDVYPACKGKGATERQKRAVRAALEDFPGVERVAFETKEAIYEKFRAQLEEDGTSVSFITLEDMPESFRVYIGPDFDRRGFRTMAERLPGVSNAIDPACLIEREKYCFD